MACTFIEDNGQQRDQISTVNLLQALIILLKSHIIILCLDEVRSLFLCYLNLFSGQSNLDTSLQSFSFSVEWFMNQDLLNTLIGFLVLLKGVKCLGLSKQNFDEEDSEFVPTCAGLRLCFGDRSEFLDDFEDLVAELNGSLEVLILEFS